MSKLKNSYALIIGTEYDDGLDTNGDAEDIARILKDRTISGYPPKNVMLLTNKMADRKGILKAFDTLIKRTDESSSVFLYYSGHGGDYTYEETDERVFYFCPYGFGMEPQIPIEEAEKVWIKADEIKKKISKLRSKRLIFFLDCCHSAGLTMGGLNVIKQKNTTTKKFKKASGLAQKVDNERGISIVSSCNEDQLSYQLEDDKNSLFTKCLLEAINGIHLKSVEEPYIRIMEVSSYLMREVPKRLKEFGVDQKPYANLQMYDNFILSYVPKSVRVKLGIKEPIEGPEPIAKGQKEVKTSFRETKGANNLLLFIHGFSGEASDTFGSIPDMLMKDSRMDGWDMKPFGYSQYVTPEMGKDIWAGIEDIDRISDYLSTSVKYKFDKYDRIAIVAHSLGGLIAQRAILNFKEEFQDKISHIILLGTPSNGIEPAKLTKLWNNKYQQMSSEGKFITALRQDWKNKFTGEYPFKLKIVASTDDEFVTIDSCYAPFGKDHQVTIDGKHLSMVKPENENDDCYGLILNTLTDTEFANKYTNNEEINIALGKYDVVVKQLLPKKDALDKNGLKRLVFSLEGLDRREEALKILNEHPSAQEDTDLMGIIGGRYKRSYLKFPSESDGDAAFVYYDLALEKSTAAKNYEQMYYHAINLAFLSIVIENDKQKMRTYAQQALDAAANCEDDPWKNATVAEANLYLRNFDKAKEFYVKAAENSGIREKISIHLNAYAGYTALMQTDNPEDDFILFLKKHFLS